MAGKTKMESRKKKRTGMCRICFQRYLADGERKPKSLPCNHTFCSECLLSNITGGILVCPTCQTEHQYPFVETSTEKQSTEGSPEAEKNARQRAVELEALEKQSQEFDAQLKEMERELLHRRKRYDSQMEHLLNVLKYNEKLVEGFDKQAQSFEEAKMKGIEQRKRLEKELEKLDAAECYEEVFAIVEEIDHCHNNIDHWKQILDEQTQQEAALRNKVCQMAQNFQLVKETIEVVNRFATNDSTEWLKSRMNQIISELSEKEKDLNAQAMVRMSSANSQST